MKPAGRQHFGNRKRPEKASPTQVYFEEWDEPMISGIRWVSELVEIAGGEDVFRKNHLRKRKRENDRRPRGGYQKKSRRDHRLLVRQEIQARARRRAAAGGTRCRGAGPACITKSNPREILQPGPAALIDGLDALVAIVDEWRRQRT